VGVAGEVPDPQADEGTGGADDADVFAVEFGRVFVGTDRRVKV
jgi:hypothetical protein